jgi:FAD/FMN-containing dehydrogenase
MNVKGLPATVIIPAVEEDIVSAVKFASDNGYKLIPAGGTHGPFVPIDEQVVYLNMCKFDAIDLSEDEGHVTFGGGAKTGSVLRKLAGLGWYTSNNSFFYLFDIIQIYKQISNHC